MTHRTQITILSLIAIIILCSFNNTDRGEFSFDVPKEDLTEEEGFKQAPAVMKFGGKVGVTFSGVSAEEMKYILDLMDD